MNVNSLVTLFLSIQFEILQTETQSFKIHKFKPVIQKIVEYLLNARHPDGSGKARFFCKFGFRPESWEDLAGALKHLAMEGTVVQLIESVHGSKYIIEGRLRSPSGRRPRVRTVWILESGDEGARLVTAYPQEDS